MTQWDLADTIPGGVDAVVVPAFTDRPGEVPHAAFAAACGFTGRPGETLPLPGDGDGPAGVLLGLGARTALDDDTLRSAAAVLARTVRGFRHLALPVPGPGTADPAPGAVRAAVEGFVLGGYRFTRHRSAPAGPAAPDRVTLVAGGGGDVAALTEGRRLAEATVLARDLVNEPGEELTPEAFADLATGVAARHGLACEVWDAGRVAAERLAGLLAVARGSLRPPRLVRLTYAPGRPAAGALALVGKGVTYDAGGLSIKPNAEMLTMKADMAGAAAVLGAMTVLRDLACPVRVDAWLPLTENMPNADPVRVGDVLRMRGGRTVEIRNADAEGRLIMADVLTLAAESAPGAIVDVATLTDAAPIALGRKIAAVMGNDPALTDRVRAAADRAGEPVWPLPLSDRYRHQLDSPVADLVNYTIGNRHGTALLAGMFLREFVPAGLPWAHLDIQGTALADADDAEWTPGATGFGVRTLAELCRAGG